jgi:transposase
VPGTPCPGSQQARPAENSRHPRDPKRRLLRPEVRMPLEAAAQGLSTVGDRLLVVRKMASGWDLGAAQRGAAPTTENPLGKERSSECRHRRLPVGQEHRCGRRAQRIRRQQEGEGHSKRHLLVDTEGLVLKAKVHSAKVPDQDGLRLLLQSARSGLSRLKHLWLDAGYEGRGRRWAEEVMGLSVEVVRKPPKPVPEEVAKRWAGEWAKEGKKIDWQGLMPPRGYVALPRRWVVERTFSWLGQNRRMSLGITRGFVLARKRSSMRR